MKEYYGKSAKNYKPRKVNQYILFPGIKRAIKGRSGNKIKLLDAGCGRGDIFPIAKKLGYDYCGFDVSGDMIASAKETYPEANFFVANTSNFINKTSFKFDYIVLSMVLPAIRGKANIKKTLEKMRSSLNKDGQLIISIGHPSFNHYMQKFLFDRNDVEVNFQGYFKSDIKFRVLQKFDTNNFLFEDYHRKISDYFNLIVDSGFKVDKIDECKPVKTRNSKTNKFLEKYNNFPIYLIFNCTLG
jgi:SAM-dependent methyltransferase